MVKKALLVSWHNSSAESMAPIYERMAGLSGWEPTLAGYHPAITGPDGEGVFDKRRLPYTKIADEPSGVTLERMGEIIDEVRPDIVVGGTSPPGSRGLERSGPEQLAFDAARQRSVPTLSVIDYWRVENRYSKGAYGAGGEAGGDGWLKHLPDRIAALDETNSKAEMVRLGIPEEIIEVTGNPQHDHLGRLSEGWSASDTARMRRELGVPVHEQDKYLVLLLSSVRDDMLYRDRDGYWDLGVIDAVMRGLNEVPGSRRQQVFVGIRNHPGEKEPILRVMDELAKSYAAPRPEGGYGLPVKFLDAKRHPISTHPDSMTLGADLSIAPRSNLLTAGTLMDGDCMSLQPERSFEGGKEDPLIVNTLDLVPHAYKTEESVDMVRRAIIDPDHFFEPYRDKRRSSGFSVDGKATDKVMALIEEMVA